MITVMAGARGCGKTKTLIDSVNKAAENTHGCVVCIEWGNKLTFDIVHHVRLIDAKEYDITTADKLFGFIKGILATNYDVTDLFIDSALKMCKDNFDAQEALAKILNELQPFLALHNISCFVTASVPIEEVHGEITKFLI